jgi:hypothetical protein
VAVAEEDFHDLARPGLDGPEDVAVGIVDSVLRYAEMDVVAIAAVAVAGGEVFAAVAYSDQGWQDSQTVDLVDDRAA